LSRRLIEHSIYEVAEKIRTQETTVEEVVHQTLEQIKKLNNKINAFITILEEQALKDAEKLDKELKKENKPRSRLHGIPVSVKDIIYVKGVRCTAGSKIMKDHVAGYDATVVNKLKEAGAVIIGTNNLHEFASGVTSVNPHFGVVRNPWDFGRIAGGSSGGSAAAVSSFMSFASIGTDTSGSIRIPSSLCGVVGLKPSYGRVSKYGVFPLSWSLDHVGPITRSVRDAAILLREIAGYDYRDDASVFADVLDYPELLETDITGYRICYLRNLYQKQLPRDVEKIMNNVIDCLSSLGAEVAEENFKYADKIRPCWAPIRLGEAAAVHDDWYRERPHDYGDDVRKMLERGRRFSLIDYVKAQRMRITIREELLRIMDRYHAVILPTTAIPAPRIGEEEVEIDGEKIDIYTALTDLTILFNITGVPAITIPAGFSQNLPLGLQIAGKPYNELTILRIAYNVEQELNLSIRPAIA